MSIRITSLLIAMIASVTAVNASVPVIVGYGAGRRAVMNLLTHARDRLKHGDTAGAKHDLDVALHADPTFWPALHLRAQIFTGEGKYDLAIQDCNEALRQYPGFIEAALLRARINSHLGKYAEALKEFNYLVTIHPRSVTLARALSDRAWFSGDLPKPIISQWPTGDQRRQSCLQYHDVEGREHDRYAGRSLCRDRRF